MKIKKDITPVEASENKVPMSELPDVKTNTAASKDSETIDNETIENNSTEATEDKETDTSPIAVIGTDITEKKLADLKKEYRKVFKTSFIDDIFIWHRLDRRTFSKIVADTKDIEDIEERLSKREQEFVRATVVYPKKEELEKFVQTEDVLVTTLSEEILYRSGFVPPRTEQI